MPDLFVRDVPLDVKRWVDAKAEAQQQTRREFVTQVLREAYGLDTGPSLFDNAPATMSPPNGNPLPFTFIDLFAGIGGLRLGMERNGGRCVFSSE